METVGVPCLQTDEDLQDSERQFALAAMCLPSLAPIQAGSAVQRAF
jgi:hypothetical protein